MNSIEDQTEVIHQCPMCNSQGEIMIDEQRMKSLEIEKKLLAVSHIKKLEFEIENLMKQKAQLQDQLDKYIDKEMEQR